MGVKIIGWCSELGPAVNVVLVTFRALAGGGVVDAETRGKLPSVTPPPPKLISGRREAHYSTASQAIAGITLENG